MLTSLSRQLEGRGKETEREGRKLERERESERHCSCNGKLEISSESKTYNSMTSGQPRQWGRGRVEGRKRAK